MWPRNEGKTRPLTISIADERGFAYWPAIRPTVTTGIPVTSAQLAASWTSRSARAGAVPCGSVKDSAHGPAWRRNRPN
jgi:hypothetical protein